MITPLDIENKEFKKGLRGYNEHEVDTYLDEIKKEYENLYRENIELKDKLNALSEQIKRYKTIEETLKETLIVAQQTAEEVNASAQRKSSLIIDEAHHQAKKIVEQANNDVIQIKKDYENIRKEFVVFKGKFKSLLEDGISSIEETFKDIE